MVSLKIVIWVIVRRLRGIWSKMDYVHQISFVPNLKGLGAGKQVVDKVAFKVIVLVEGEIIAKSIKEEVIDLGDSVELTMLLIPTGKFLMEPPDDEANHEDDEI